jgi:hypothetical protein
MGSWGQWTDMESFRPAVSQSKSRILADTYRYSTDLLQGVGPKQRMLKDFLLHVYDNTELEAIYT